MFLSVITKNLNWKILRVYLLLKDGMGLRMKNFNIMRVHWKIQWRFTKNQYIGAGVID